MLRTIWERHFLGELVKTFLLLSLGFYTLYVLIDYSSRTAVYRGGHFTYAEMGGYYLYTWIQRLDILVPFALVVSVVKTLSSLSLNNELVALISSGVSKKRLMRPFFLFGLLLAALLFFNTETLLPLAARKINQLKDRHHQLRQNKSTSPSIHQLALKDGSTLLYRHYDTARELFLDLYWIRSSDEIYRMKALDLPGGKATGRFVDELRRNQKGELVRTAFYPERELKSLPVEKSSLASSLSAPSEQPLTELWKELFFEKNRSEEKRGLYLSAFLKKAILPWLCLLAVAAPAPFCLSFGRQQPVFLIYLFSMFALFAAYVLLNSASILADSHLLPPLLVNLIPASLFASIIFLSYFKL